MSVIEFKSQSGTLALFDPLALKHRLLKPRGWWQNEREALHEIHQGRMALVELGLTGTYLVRHISNEQFEQITAEELLETIEFQIHTPSGHLFVGRAESTTGDELEPDADFGDIVLAVPVGTQRVQIARHGDHELLLSIARSSDAARNDCDELPRLKLM